MRIAVLGARSWGTTVASLLPGHPAAALTGPNLAKEIMAGQAAASVIATEDLAVARALQSVLQRGMFRVYTNHDVIGCELGGALKNVVAIAAGVAQGLGVGTTPGRRWSPAAWPSSPGSASRWAARRPPSPGWPAWATSWPPA
jgi:glycerol-3-phosphate dehydrogenase